MLEPQNNSYTEVAAEKFLSALEGFQLAAAGKYGESITCNTAGLISKAKKLIEELSHDNPTPTIYLSKTDLMIMSLNGMIYEDGIFRLHVSSTEHIHTLPPCLKRTLKHETQDHYRIMTELEEYHRSEQQPRDERPDRGLFREAQRIMCWTNTGEEADKHIHLHKVPVLFVDAVKNDKTNRGGTYSPSDGKIRIYRDDGNKRWTATKIVHEARHSSQHINFPELYAHGLDIIDRFVAMKLRELDAYATDCEHQLHIFKCESELKKLFRENLPNTTAEIYGRALVDALDSKAIEKGMTGADFLPILIGQYTAVDWPYYERHFYCSNMISIIKSGDFEQRISASQFLQPEFLKRFCIDPRGKSYLPEDPSAFFGELTKQIAALHHPVLARMAQSATKPPHRESIESLSGAINDELKIG